MVPRLWFGVLCNGVGRDEAGRITLQQVFNQVKYETPPAGTALVPFARLSAILAIGFSEGLGRFDAAIDLRDIDGHVLWERPDGRWAFALGPGEANAAVLVEQVEYWFTEPGRYFFQIRLSPTEAHQILFEVATQVGPAQQQGEQPA
jgi:hypothetical protein